MNSILTACESMADDCLASEIVQMIRAHSNDHKILIVTEGITDRNVYGSFYNKDKYDVYTSSRFAGCLNFELLLREINTRYENRYLVIKDADFDHLNGITYDGFPNLFLTDTHDLETMMIAEGFFESMQQQYKETDVKSVVYDAAKEILFLSYLKWMNCKSGIKLNFGDCCQVGSCYKGTCCIEPSLWLKQIYSYEKNGQKDIIKEDRLLAFKDSHPITDDTLWQITNGHDLVAAITIKLKAVRRHNIKKKEIEKVLTNSFHFEDYQKTRLYRQISDWINSLLT